MNHIERIVNFTAAVIGISTFIFSFTPVFSVTLNLPEFFGEGLSLFRFFVAVFLLICCNFAVSYPCSKLLMGGYNRAIRNACYGIFVLSSCWMNIFIIKYILFAEKFYGTYILGYTIIVIISALLFIYFIEIHLDEKKFSEKEFKSDIPMFLFFIYIIIWFSTVFVN